MRKLWTRADTFLHLPMMKGMEVSCRFHCRKKVSILCILLTAVLLSVISACSSFAGNEDGSRKTGLARGAEEPVTREIFAMDTYMTLTVYEEAGEGQASEDGANEDQTADEGNNENQAADKGDNGGQFAGKGVEEALDAAEAEISRIEKLLSTGLADSEISKLNKSGEEDVSEDTAYLIRRSKELYEDTNGLFDITVYPLMKAWGFDTGNYRVPDDRELKSLLGHMGADKIMLDGVTHVSLLDKDNEIDLGGIAKGYTSGRLKDIFREYGIKHAIVSLGGNVDTLGDKPDGSFWKVAVKDPADTSAYAGIIQVKDKAVITSGGYERYFTEKGRFYHHIIDPGTGYPAGSGLASVTIVSEDSTLADGLSTALYIMGKDKAAEYWREHSDVFDMILIGEDGSIFVSEGISDSFSSDREWEIIEN